MYKKITLSLSFLGVFNYSISCMAASEPVPSTPASATTSQGQENKGENVKPIDKIEILSPWARASLPPNNNSAVYLTIKNNSDSQYTLINAEAMEVANNVELHQSYVDEKGISKMTSIDKIVIPANSEIALKPTDMHIMLLDLKSALKVGDRIKLNLIFSTIGSKTVEMEVKSSD